MKPAVDIALTENGHIKFVSINIDEDVEKAREYRVRSIPTLLLIEDNDEVDRLVGSHSTERVKEFLKR
jgi:thioredoxin-like negative regulator of GroEL